MTQRVITNTLRWRSGRLCYDPTEKLKFESSLTLSWIVQNATMLTHENLNKQIFICSCILLTVYGRLVVISNEDEQRFRSLKILNLYLYVKGVELIQSIYIVSQTDTSFLQKILNFTSVFFCALCRLFVHLVLIYLFIILSLSSHSVPVQPFPQSLPNFRLTSLLYLKERQDLRGNPFYCVLLSIFKCVFLKRRDEEEMKKRW
jgi:hypothetical protein